MQNHFQFEHDHTGPFSNNVLSGIYYYKTNGSDGDLVFMSPNPFQLSGISSFGDSEVRFKPEEGKLLLFPPWLRHRVEINKTEHIRISIAFNLKLLENSISTNEVY